MKKNKLTGKSKINIAICTTILTIVILLIVNIFFSCKAGASYANLFAAISGWVGFLATAGIGIITLLQNRIYEHRAYIQYHTDKLIRTRDIIHINAMQISRSNTMLNSKAMQWMLYGTSKPLFDEMSNMVLLSNQVEAQIHDLYNLRYKFVNIKCLFENLCKFLDNERRFVNRPQINEVYLDCIKLYKDVQQNYFDLLVEMDNVVQFLLDKNKGYRELEDKIIDLEDCEYQREEPREILEKYNKLAEEERAKR